MYILVSTIADEIYISTIYGMFATRLRDCSEQQLKDSVYVDRNICELEGQEWLSEPFVVFALDCNDMRNSIKKYFLTR